jgi:hypothetical protein
MNWKPLLGFGGALEVGGGSGVAVDAVVIVCM